MKSIEFFFLIILLLFFGGIGYLGWRLFQKGKNAATVSKPDQGTKILMTGRLAALYKQTMESKGKRTLSILKK